MDWRIERNICGRWDRSAIAAQSDFLTLRHEWFPSTGVVIRDNYVEDIGGDGIIVGLRRCAGGT